MKTGPDRKIQKIVWKNVKRWWRDETGATAIEYVVVLAGVLLAVVTVGFADITPIFDNFGSALDSPQGGKVNLNARM
ncbi:Flp family type IVb pilin [Ponticoccus sp. SC2-23]|uniref:Flp family type IVb pilin n=1 Tax=Alexandriicola marinus TaxID=2081710 RepID=UPI0013DEE018|nr:Flp family type IVb pilin [Alexandriicola marinus]MBM1221015.1 Flp family type IVb pilin [Ponticoccus sp. SC6-9]MBM1225585.1 Flp family type IVb pilin [Ponticoccus sp. SC6-15]MBM1227737.1 Flp family type IVb pilin [Ponticoccus sp. SC6-38]MBM1234625.1 Flp family type IVb pilin [Ponticoccus sp. SC6-45]MBM1238239.1 Flp family type IVb pilin [Ponticoccus sp. SC6-49]MBM1243508.1 Flp family type IVb pilin [Ponticoccus sp. SC2-64]MBM1248149.1 Flp family type IVb pilin [Ponticoccus sp. SC6-42]MB